MFTISEEVYAENTAVKSQAHAQVCQNSRSKGRHTPARFFILQKQINRFTVENTARYEKYR